jgi:DNA-binding PadR family transcriptional regulator
MEPLTPAVFHILLALADGEKHGYAIMQDVSVQSKDKVTMGPGTLYGTLQRMLESRLIEECVGRRDSALNEERRRYYRLTRSGRKAASAEAARLDELVRYAYEKAILKRPIDEAC